MRLRPPSSPPSSRWRGRRCRGLSPVRFDGRERLDLFGGAIAEGPYRWAVRPVAEVFVEREFETSWAISGLLGAIWRTPEDLSVDIGLRAARLNGELVGEVRAGFTWAFGLR